MYLFDLMAFFRGFGIISVISTNLFWNENLLLRIIEIIVSIPASATNGQFLLKLFFFVFFSMGCGSFFTGLQLFLQPWSSWKYRKTVFYFIFTTTARGNILSLIIVNRLKALMFYCSFALYFSPQTMFSPGTYLFSFFFQRHPLQKGWL